MAAAASAASNPRPGEPPVTLTTNTDREAWVNFDPVRFMDLCSTAYQYGDFSYVQTALRANHETATDFINDRIANNVNEITGQESFQMMRMFQKTNAMISALMFRNAALERDASMLVE